MRTDTTSKLAILVESIILHVNVFFLKLTTENEICLIRSCDIPDSQNIFQFHSSAVPAIMHDENNH